MVDRKATANLVRQNEGVRYTVYTDTVGKLTIGIGFNLQRSGARDRVRAVGANYDQICSGSSALTEAQVNGLFALDLEDAIRDGAALVENFTDHPEEIQTVIVDMIFNLGAQGFQKFEKTIAALEAKDYAAAAAQMADSVWAAQVPNRARPHIATVMRYSKS